ncbi:hypothetical protein [Nocardioides piscis]|uniref:DUF222 domain-containing protein n=1 Tax=Nocardioides piscis TaxID=2714938 RepID=A0A6G7YFN9_9ACTN|nr:hypothetical protein [Nocardioides piscis]QIK75486.1 hypothetical protein G7071_08565 [Nocardioides piscis]
MTTATALEDMGEAELLAHAEAVARAQRQAEVETIRIAVQHAVLNSVGRLDPDGAARPGREQARRFGGAGTPKVLEFAPAVLGARLGVSTGAAHALMADALDIAHRLPRLWGRVEALEVKASYARYVARRTRDLGAAQAAHVDARVHVAADGRIPWARFEALVEGAIAASDPEAAAEREREAATKQLAQPTRSTEHGMRGFYVRAPLHVIARLDAIVSHLARILLELGDTDTNDERRVKAVLLLTDPRRACELLRRYAEWRDRPDDPAAPDDGDRGSEPETPRSGDRPEVDWDALMPTVTLFLHLYAQAVGDQGEQVARIEGHGPVTTTWLRHTLGPHARFTIRPVLDLEGQAPVDAYEIPERHRQAVHLMTPADTFPWGSSTSRTQQIDHTVPYSRGAARAGAGQSRVGNYGPMTTFHHRVKTHAGWDVRQPFPGIYLWRDPVGATYLVDNTGTRRIAQAA